MPKIFHSNNKRRILPIVNFLLVGGIFPGSALAQNAPEDESVGLEQMVVTATRTETPISQLTRSVTVVTNQEIQQQAGLARNLGDVLAKTVPGLGPSSEALSSFSQTLRGRDFLVLIDGIPQSTPLRSSSRDLNTIDVDAIERIEVIRGGTAAYGFGAAGGLINIITKKPAKEALAGYSQASVRVSTEHLDDSAAWQTTQRVSGTKDNIDYLASGTFIQRNGYFDADGDRIPPDPLGNQGGLADTNEYNILGKFGFNFDQDRQRLQFFVNHFNIKQDTDFTFAFGDPNQGIKTPAVPGSFNAADPGTTNTLASMHYINRDLLGSHVKLNAYYGDLTARFSKFPGFAQTEIQSQKYGTRLTIDTPLAVRDYDFSLIWGIDFLRDETVQAGIDGPTVVPNMQENALAGFLELELPLSDLGLLRGGFRYEHISVDIDDIVNRGGTLVRGDTLNYGKPLFNASAVFYLTDEIEAFGSFSQSFSVADIGRAIRDANSSITSAGQLESNAQKVNSYEIGLRGGRGPLQASAAGFYSTSNNGTTFNQDLSIVKQPERIWGAEGTLAYRFNSQWNTGGTVTWVAGEVDLNDDDDYEEDLPNTRVPPVKLTGFLEYSPWRWWDNRMQVLYVGDRSPDSTQFGGGEVDDYTIVDLISRFKVGPGYLGVAVKNLLNNDYFPLVSQAGRLPYAFSTGPGRTVRISYALNW
ncbi:TonB-dependent receptor [Nitrosococcus oceani]|uniref:TonB-dependent receptor n=1 Tax=Nitrosococcus oceani TaxID=1229 RepID=UPI0004E93E64|nr:TonB-dependent receptor [Nitrosococcus oceani]KFI22467.1 ligand-gated channel [Nitrosococcus oceani]